MSKNFLSLILFLVLATTFSVPNTYGADSVSAPVYKDVSALEVVKNPNKYLKQNIQIIAKFDKFTALGLDYNNALRSSEKYIGLTIQRDDIKDHNVPLSEMKLFLKQDSAEKFADLDTGDVIKIQGKVFSAALKDPWVDVDKITVIKKVKETK